jgi:peptide/nickel transport system substrate-binding protein
MSVLSLPPPAGNTRQRAANVTALNNMGVFGQQGRMSRRLATALSLWLLGASAAAACSRNAPARRRTDAGQAGEPEGEPVRGALSLPVVPPCEPGAGAAPAAAGKGGVLRIHLPVDPPHLNPLADNLEVVEQVTRGLVYEPLVECVGGHVAPALAESWSWSPDGLRLELQVRSGVTWHDGRALTAIDAQASLESPLRSSSRLGATRASLADVVGVDVVADRSVRLRLARPSTIVLRALCDVPIVPARLVRGGTAERARLGRQPIGTGPFRLAAWEPGVRIRLEPVPGPRPARLAQIVFEVDPDPASALRRLRRAELDLLPRLNEVHYPEQVTPAALGPGLRALRVLEPRLSFVAINHRRPVLEEARVRQALDLLWNRARIAADVHRDLAIPVGSIGTAPAPAFAPPAAARLLDEAGLVDGDKDRFREFQGQPLALGLLRAADSPAAEQAAERFALDAARAGLRVQIQPLDPDKLRERLRTGDFDLALLSWRGRPGEDLRPLFGEGGAFNHGAFHAPAVQELLDQLAVAAEGTEGPLQARLSEALGREHPALFLFRHQRVVVLSRNVQGLCHDGRDLDVRGVWLSP